MSMTSSEASKLISSIGNISTQVKETKEGLDSIKEKFVEMDKEGALKDQAHERSIRDLDENMGSVLKILRGDGNGAESVVQRLRSVESNQKSMQQNQVALKDAMEKFRPKKTGEGEAKYGWLFRKEVVIAVVSFITIMGGMFYSRTSAAEIQKAVAIEIQRRDKAVHGLIYSLPHLPKTK